MSQYDVAIIGGGAAGLSAALVLSRAGRRVVVVDAGQPRNAAATHLHGFLSRDGMAPAALLEAGRAEVRGYGGEFLNEPVSAVTPDGDTGFRILFNDGQPISARRLLIATGLRDELPNIAGLRERWAVDVLHCPYCHGHEVRDQHLGVIGGTPGAVRFAQIVRQWTSDLVYSTPPDVLTTTE
jgi:thioredoxin reductase